MIAKENFSIISTKINTNERNNTIKKSKFHFIEKANERKEGSSRNSEEEEIIVNDNSVYKITSFITETEKLIMEKYAMGKEGNNDKSLNNIDQTESNSIKYNLNLYELEDESKVECGCPDSSKNITPKSDKFKSKNTISGRSKVSLNNKDKGNNKQNRKNNKEKKLITATCLKKETKVDKGKKLNENKIQRKVNDFSIVGDTFVEKIMKRKGLCHGKSKSNCFKKEEGKYKTYKCLGMCFNDDEIVDCEQFLRKNYITKRHIQSPLLFYSDKKVNFYPFRTLKNQKERRHKEKFGKKNYQKISKLKQISEIEIARKFPGDRNLRKNKSLDHINEFNCSESEIQTQKSNKHLASYKTKLKKIKAITKEDREEKDSKIKLLKLKKDIQNLVERNDIFCRNNKGSNNKSIRSNKGFNKKNNKFRSKRHNFGYSYDESNDNIRNNLTKENSARQNEGSEILNNNHFKFYSKEKLYSNSSLDEIQEVHDGRMKDSESKGRETVEFNERQINTHNKYSNQGEKGGKQQQNQIYVNKNTNSNIETSSITPVKTMYAKNIYRKINVINRNEDDISIDEIEKLNYEFESYKSEFKNQLDGLNNESLRGDFGCSNNELEINEVKLLLLNLHFIKNLNDEKEVRLMNELISELTSSTPSHLYSKPNKIKSDQIFIFTLSILKLYEFYLFSNIIFEENGLQKKAINFVDKHKKNYISNILNQNLISMIKVHKKYGGFDDEGNYIIPLHNIKFIWNHFKVYYDNYAAYHSNVFGRWETGNVLRGSKSKKERIADKNGNIERGEGGLSKFNISEEYEKCENYEGDEKVNIFEGEVN